jgi:hypothetical protein
MSEHVPAGTRRDAPAGAGNEDAPPAALRQGTLRLPTPRRRRVGLRVLLALLGLHVSATTLLALRHYQGRSGASWRFEVRDGRFVRDGEAFVVKGVGWDPARPGELPWSRACDLALAEQDFSRMAAAGFNTVRTWDAMTPEELALARRHGLAVLQGVWIDPATDFADPEALELALARATDVARASRGSGAVLAYMIMNEPEPAHVLSVGLDPTRRFLRRVAERIRHEHPGALVSFASWPGLELLDVPSLDFVAVNLHPFRPPELVDALGYTGMLATWRQRAGPRPLIVSEHGISVAPVRPAPGLKGGGTEAEQAVALVELADAVMGAGAAGGCVFSWLDGWWKSDGTLHDARAHDPDDGEEWFGLVAFDRPGDREGRARPALDALRAWNRAVLTRPESGPVTGRHVVIELHAPETDVDVEVSLEGAPAVLVPLDREGAWLRGRIGLDPRRRGPQRLDFAVVGPDGVGVRARRVVVPPGEADSLEVWIDGHRGDVVARVTRPHGGSVPEETEVSVVAAETRSGRWRSWTVQAGGGGEARVALDGVAPGEVVVAFAALRGRAGDPPLATAQAVHAPAGGR